MESINGSPFLYYDDEQNNDTDELSMFLDLSYIFAHIQNVLVEQCNRTNEENLILSICFNCCEMLHNIFRQPTNQYYNTLISLEHEIDKFMNNLSIATFENIKNKSAQLGCLNIPTYNQGIKIMQKCRLIIVNMLNQF